MGRILLKLLRVNFLLGILGPQDNLCIFALPARVVKPILHATHLTQCELLGVTLPLFGPQGSHLKNGSNDNPCSSASRSRGWPITVIRVTLSIHICCVTALWKHKKPSGPDVYYCITWLWGLRCQFQIQPYHLVAVCCWVGHILSLSLNLNISNVGSWDCCKD